MKRFLITSLVLLALASSCAPSTASPTTSPARKGTIAKPQLTLDTLPHISGSTSTQPLTVILLCNLLGWQYIWFEEATGDSPRSAAPVLDVEKTKTGTLNAFWERARHSKTHESYVELIERKADPILVAREPSSDELKLMSDKRVSLDVHPVAWDALVFVVNKSNPITALTLEQIREIYSGKPTMWELLGGKSKDTVKPLVRNENSGSHELFKKLVIGDRKIVVEKSDVIMSMIGLIDRVGAGQNDLGYSIFYYVQFMVGIGENKPPVKYLFEQTSVPIKPIAINGTMPEQQTIATGTYPLHEPVYVVIRKDTSPTVVQLRDWILGDEGQKVVAESGYVAFY